MQKMEFLAHQVMNNNYCRIFVMLTKEASPLVTSYFVLRAVTRKIMLTNYDLSCLSMTKSNKIRQ